MQQAQLISRMQQVHLLTQVLKLVNFLVLRIQFYV